MHVFETVATLDDASHLTLREPVPQPTARECRVIVLFDADDDAPSAWPAGFFDEIRIADPVFARPPQGNLSPSHLSDTFDCRLPRTTCASFHGSAVC